MRPNSSIGSVHWPCPQRSRTLIPWQSEPASTEIPKNVRNAREKDEIFHSENEMGTLENRLGEFLGSWWVSSSAVSNWGGSDLRFLRMKKPARVAERKTRMNLRGHISVLNLSDGRRQIESERETIEKCGGSDNRGRSRKGAVEKWSILVRESGH